jgi:hypothetical protein
VDLFVYPRVVGFWAGGGGWGHTESDGWHYSVATESLGDGGGSKVCG